MTTSALHLLQACVASALVLSANVSNAVALDDDRSLNVPATLCSAATPRLPPTITLTDDLQRPIETMLKRSATFREQCRRIASAPRLHVLVRVNVQIVGTSCRARSVIQTTTSGIIVAVVEISPAGDPVPWIAHEFEHLLEQLDGLRLTELADRHRGVWRTIGETFETERAIRAGRQVADEISRKTSAGDIFVEPPE